MIRILKKIFTSFVILSFINSIAFAQSVSNNTLPTNPNVISGSANISQTANKLTVNQNTDKLITNWSSFNIGKDATVQFVQPSSTSSALNRVTSSDPSYIFGTLQANGKIILINPNGVLFANGAKVDVGSIIASTLKMADKDYLSDQLIFEKDNLAGTIQNDGTIRAFAGGTVALIGSQVTNNGKIKTKQGTTALLAGDKVTLTLNGNRLIKYTIDQGALNSLVENNNAIIAKEGVVILSAKGLNLLSKSVVNNTGSIEAKGFSQSGGKIYLDGDQTTNSGKLVASSKNNSGGLIQVTADEIKLTSTASLDASGATGGGNILVGGSYQNSNPTVRQSRKTIIEGGSVLNASATKDGDGGTIVAWSDINNPDSITSAQGTFLATGGLNSGNGGNIETSGHYLSTDLINVNASGLGTSGTWLLDPYNITIGSSSSGTTYAANFIPTSTSVIKASDIVASLNSGTSVIITTGSAGSDSGDITISNSTPISKTAGGDATLTLEAARNITVGTSSAITSTSGTLGITLKSATASAATTGGVRIGSNLTSNGGDILIGGGQGIAVNGIGYAQNYAGGSSDQTSSAIQINAVTISSGAGKIVLNGENKISTSGGNISVNNPAGVYIAPNSNITSTTGSIYSTTKSSGPKEFALAIDQTSSSITTINSTSGGSIRLDATNSVTPTVAMGLTNSGQRATIRFSSLPTVAGLFILINGSIQPVTYTAETNVACTVSITNCGFLTVSGSNSSYQNAIYGSSTAVTKATYVTVAGKTKGYDGLDTALNLTSSDFTKESLITWPTLFTDTYIAANYNFKTSSKNVGSYSSLTDYNSSGTTPATYTDGTGIYAIGWTYTSPYTITAKTLTTTLASTVPKEYNATLAATLSNSNFSVPTGVSGETISVTKTTGTYDNKNVGTGKTVTANLASGDYSITGTNALLSNYTLTTGDVTGNVGTITQKALTMSGLSVPSSKVYDGTITAVVTDNKVFTGSETAGTGTTSDGKWYTGDTVNFTGTATGTYNFKDVSTATTVTYGGLSLTGAQAGNYSLTQQTPAAATITQKTVGLLASKTYDGNTSLTDRVTVTTDISGEALTYTGATANDSHVATSSKYINGITLANGTGGLATNYKLPTLNNANAPVTITAATLTPTISNTSVTKEYDGTTATSITPTYSFSGFVSGDSGATLANTSKLYNSAHVASANSVTVSGLSISGITGSNSSATTDYALDSTSKNVSAAITAKTLTPTLTNTSVTKEYDSTRATSITPTYSFSGFVSGDTDATLTYDTKLYNSKNVNDANKVTVSGLGINSITGNKSSLASDYSLSSSSKDVAATITTKTLTVSGITAANKDFDGTTAATVSTSGAVYSGKVTGDSVTVSTTGIFASAEVGTGKTVNLTNTYTGTDVTNYNITNQSTTTANITLPEEKKTTTNSKKVKCELEDCNKNKLVSGEIVIVKKNIFNDDKAIVTPISIKPDIQQTPLTKPRDSLVKIIILKPGAEPIVDKEYQVTIRGNDAILKENMDVADKTITSPGKSIGSARFSIENDKGKILEYNLVVRESGLEIRPLSFEALQFADKNKATVVGAAMIDVVNNLKLSVDSIKTIILDLIIDKVFEEAMFNSKGANKNIFNVNYY